jgi:hypothetical protein
MGHVQFQSARATSVAPVPNLAERLRFATETCWDVEARDVIYIASANEQPDPWQSVLQGLGLTVYRGAEGYIAPDEELPALVLISALEWRNEASNARLKHVLHRFPDATVCVLLGFGPHKQQGKAAAHPEYHDARALLRAAGIGFFSVEYSVYA